MSVFAPPLFDDYGRQQRLIRRGDRVGPFRVVYFVERAGTIRCEAVADAVARSGGKTLVVTEPIGSTRDPEDLRRRRAHDRIVQRLRAAVDHGA